MKKDIPIEEDYKKSQRRDSILVYKEKKILKGNFDMEGYKKSPQAPKKDSSLVFRENTENNPGNNHPKLKR